MVKKKGNPRYKRVKNWNGKWVYVLKHKKLTERDKKIIKLNRNLDNRATLDNVALALEWMKDMVNDEMKRANKIEKQSKNNSEKAYTIDYQLSKVEGDFPTLQDKLNEVHTNIPDTQNNYVDEKINKNRKWER